jgi:peptidylamidoglycolate lyase
LRKKILTVVSILLTAAIVLYAVIFTKKTTGKPFFKTSRYELVANWPKLPDDLVLGNPTGIAIDTNQNVVVFHRASREWPYIMPMPKSAIAEHTILIINKESGELIRSWGSKLFVMPHGLTIDRHNNIWITDVGLHQVFKFSYDGKLLLRLGKARMAGNDITHFNRPTDVAVARDGSFYVSDGYGNSRIIKFSASGNYLLEWGKPGKDQGEFNIPHAVDLDKDGNIYVADRENQRVQIFSSNGVFIKEWRNPDWGNICSVAFDAVRNRFVAIDDATIFKVKHIGSDILTFDSAGIETARFGRSGLYPGPLSWYHDVAVDRDGNIYVSDILGNKLQKFKLINNR